MNKEKINSSAALVLPLFILFCSVTYAAESVSAVADTAAETATPGLSGLHLQLQPAPPEYVPEKRPPALSNSNSITKFARLARETWFNEQVTCVRKSPDGKMVAVGGYLRKTSLLGKRPKRLYGSRIHVIDMATRKEVISLESAPVAERTREEKGGSKILDCMFVLNSRYLAAVTNSKLLLWDTQRGVVLSELLFDRAIDSAVLEHGKHAGQDYLAVVSGKNKRVYQIMSE